MSNDTAQGSHTSRIPMNHKSHVGGKQRSKQANPNRTARRQFKWVYETVEE